MPLMLVIGMIAASIEGNSYVSTSLGMTACLYIVYLVGRHKGSERAVQAYAVIATIFFLFSALYSASLQKDADSVLYVIAMIVFGLIAFTIESNIRIKRLEAPMSGNNSRACEYPGIYAIRCRANGKEYIGQTSQPIKDRWAEHYKMLYSNRHHNRWLQDDWNLYRPEVFEFRVLEVVTDPVWLLDRERAWQDNGYDAAKRYNPPNIARPVARSRKPVRRQPLR